MKDKLQHVLSELDSLERTEQMSGLLQGIDARAKLIVTLVFLIAMLSVPLSRLSEILFFFVFPIISASMGGLNYSSIFRRSLVVLPFIAFIGLFNIIYDREPAFLIGSWIVTKGWIYFFSIIFRGLLSVQALLVLIYSTGYYRICRSMQRLGVPSLFTTQLLFVYRYLYVLTEEILAMSRARDARSFGRKSYPLKIWGTLVGQLLIRTFDRAECIGRAMQARGFTGHIPAGICERSRWRMRDTIFLVSWISVLVLMRAFGPAELFSRFVRNLQ